MPWLLSTLIACSDCASDLV